jgi:hypothetical protein
MCRAFSNKSVKIFTNYRLFVTISVTLMLAIKNVSKSVEISCQMLVHLFEKSDTFAERKKKDCSVS